jgi:hypothetical protein
MRNWNRDLPKKQKQVSGLDAYDGHWVKFCIHEIELGREDRNSKRKKRRGALNDVDTLIVD